MLRAKIAQVLKVQEGKTRHKSYLSWCLKLTDLMHLMVYWIGYTQFSHPHQEQHPTACKDTLCSVASSSTLQALLGRQHCSCAPFLTGTWVHAGTAVSRYCVFRQTTSGYKPQGCVTEVNSPQPALGNQGEHSASCCRHRDRQPGGSLGH